MSLLLAFNITPFTIVSIVDLEQVNAGWVNWSAYINPGFRFDSVAENWLLELFVLNEKRYTKLVNGKTKMASLYIDICTYIIAISISIYLYTCIYTV